MTDKIYKGSIGIPIIARTTFDISEATELRIYYRAPSGATGHWNAEMDTAASVKHISESDDLNEYGKWFIQAWVAIGSKEVFNEIQPIIIYQPLSDLEES